MQISRNPISSWLGKTAGERGSSDADSTYTYLITTLKKRSQDFSEASELVLRNRLREFSDNVKIEKHYPTGNGVFPNQTAN